MENNKGWHDQFIEEHVDLIKQELLHKSFELPAHFDGHELRVWIADRFEAAAGYSELRRKPRGRRSKDYKNWKLITPGV